MRVKRVFDVALALAFAVVFALLLALLNEWKFCHGSGKPWTSAMTSNAHPWVLHPCV
jgi:lipopolysaccharide/colanic/teichoic acid biosynthesis glycosyltransferase